MSEIWFRKPPVFEVVIWTGENLNEVKTLLKNMEIDMRSDSSLLITNGRHNMVQEPFWILKFNYVLRALATGKFSSYSQEDFLVKYEKYIVPEPPEEKTSAPCTEECSERTKTKK